MIARPVSSIHIESNGMAGAERVKADTPLKANPVRISGLRTDLRCESAVVRGSVLAAEGGMLEVAASTARGASN